MLNGTVNLGLSHRQTRTYQRGVTLQGWGLPLKGPETFQVVPWLQYR